MATYYALVNDTKKKSYHLDNHIKIGPMRLNEAVHRAFVNLMVGNLFDSFRIVADYDVDMSDSYEEVDLLHSNDLDDDTHQAIVDYLNNMYPKQPLKYKSRLTTVVADPQTGG
jgi:hypothetical protein